MIYPRCVSETKRKTPSYHDIHFSVGKNSYMFNPLNAKLNPICHLLALLGAHHILHVNGVRVKLIGHHSEDMKQNVQLQFC